MKNLQTTAAVLCILSIIMFGCKKQEDSVSSSGDVVTLTHQDSVKIAALEKSLDSINNIPEATVPKGTLNLSPGGGSTTALTSSEIQAYVQGGIEAVKIMRSLYDVLFGLFAHKWAIIQYADGYCCYNSVKAKRTIDDLLYTAIGKGGDCDWRENLSWKEVCLRDKSDANALIKKHGKIIRLAFIDHPTNHCGR